ncbi:hypothetical protein [Streptomyces sp. MP131-18]|uniref:hypothetical protein n=1 Tax=Streptomyces sp. MP131-18 TaxID=1857892 RepID=UPI00097C39B6|nr:hypothetical protein [Streptomyces sp. MP131-18]ONK12418.1 hypothetical protein STBA_31600 [Streptomyces sp. MP131-18]
MEATADVTVVVGDGVVLPVVAGPVQVLHGVGYLVRRASPGGRTVVSGTGRTLAAGRLAGVGLPLGPVPARHGRGAPGAGPASVP